MCTNFSNMTAKKMADIFFGNFSELISKDKNLSKEDLTISDKSSTDQIVDNKKPNQKILIYSAVILVAAILIFLIF